jgi:aerobic carbon-monoxide dehydrogenase medium subunit
MKSARFDYFRAKTLSEATSALGLDDRTAMVIAGGQSLIPMLNLRVAVPDVLVDIGRLDELKEASAREARFRVGALVTHADIEDGRIPNVFGGLLQKIAAGISYRAIRHYGTIGGSVALADPAADWPVALLALGADVRIASRAKTRSQPINEFITHQYSTSLARDEIILGFDIPIPEAPLRWGISKVARKSGAFASSLAIVVRNKLENTIRVALGAAGPRPLLLQITGKAVNAEMPHDKIVEAIANDLSADALNTDSYLVRLHTSTVIRAVQEMRSKWQH